MIKKDGEDLFYPDIMEILAVAHMEQILRGFTKYQQIKHRFYLTYVSNQVVSDGSLVRLNKNYSSITQTHNFTSQASRKYFGLETIDGACSWSFPNIMVFQR